MWASSLGSGAPALSSWGTDRGEPGSGGQSRHCALAV